MARTQRHQGSLAAKAQKLGRDRLRCFELKTGAKLTPSKGLGLLDSLTPGAETPQPMRESIAWMARFSAAAWSSDVGMQTKAI